MARSITRLDDPRWLSAEGWEKMQTLFRTSDGRKVVIHYVRNKITGLGGGFKIED